MIKTLYRPKRMRNGKRVTSRLYTLKIRLDGDRRILQIPLGVSDRQVADEKARKIVQEHEREKHGLLAPKGQRDAASAPFSKHIREFVADLRSKGRDPKYVTEMEFKLTALANECGWHHVKDVTADSFVKWRSAQTKANKTLNEYLTSAKGLLNWMVKQGRIPINLLNCVQQTDTRGKETFHRRAYTDDEMTALLNAAGTQRLLYMMAALTGIRHGEFKKLCWADINLNSEKPHVMVRASVGKNRKLTCLPIHPALLKELRAVRPVKVSAGDLLFGRLVPRSELFRQHLKVAGITKRDSQGNVVDFHSFRHTFCTNLHLAGVPLREAMELMRHSDARLTMTIYADSSLFALRPAVEKLPWNCPIADAQRDAQRTDSRGLLPSLTGTEIKSVKNGLQPSNTGLLAQSDLGWHGKSQSDEWCAVQVSNLRPLPCEGNALPLS
jgi:integrase